MLNLEKRYQKVLSELKKGHRALFKAEDTEVTEYLKHFEISLEKKDTKVLEMLFCVLSNTEHKDLRFEPYLLRFFNDVDDYNDELIIMCLSVARRHIIEARQIKGQRQDISFLKVLEKLIFHKSYEVVEWSLRLIEELGAQGLYFKRHFPKLMPGLLTFNKHKKNIKELVFILDQRFKSFPG